MNIEEQRLLKYFIELAIGYRENCCISSNIANELSSFIDGNIEELGFHIEFDQVNPDVCRLWRLSDWRSSSERLSLIREKSAAEREARLHKEEILFSFRSK